MNQSVYRITTAMLGTPAPRPVVVEHGRCPWCESEQSLTSSGRLATHAADVTSICAGSGMTPAAHEAAPFVWSPMRAVGVKPWDDER